MRTLKFVLSFLLLFEISSYFLFLSPLIHLSLTILFVFIFFALLKIFEKKIEKLISQFRKASSQVNRASLKLTGASRKLSDGNRSVSEAFNKSLNSMNQITQISEQTLTLVDQNQKQNRNTKQAAEEGQHTLLQVILEIKELATYSEKIKDVTSLIDEIAFKTNILSLNAAVEAARAGEHGKGFSVVAEAVRELAQQSSTATKKINEVIDLVVKKAENGSLHADESGTKISQILTNIDQSLALSMKVQTDTQSQTHEILEASKSLHQIDQQTQQTSALSEQAMMIAQELSVQSATFEDLISDITFAFQADIESNHLKKSLTFAKRLANTTAKLIEKKISTSNISKNSLFNFQYEEILGSKINQLSHLFSINKVPQSGFSPKKYSTSYDHLFDKEIQTACDEVFKLGPEYIFALPVDLNAYAPMHNSKFCKDWTGDSKIDLVGNRVKRFFSDNMTFLKSTRVGLGSRSNQLPQKISSREELMSLDCPLKENNFTRSQYLVQTYLRDTGELATNLSVPIFIFGERFGTIVVCWLEDEQLS